MANRTHWDAQSRTRELKTIEGIIKVVGTATPANNVVTLESLTGNGVSAVARSGVGQYTITLDDGYPICAGVNIDVEASADVDLKIQLKSRDVKTAKTVVFKTLAVATPTEVPNGSTYYFHFKINVKNAAVQ